MQRLLRIISLLGIVVVLSGCASSKSHLTPSDMDEFRRNFSHQEAAFSTGSYEESLIKSASILWGKLISYNEIDGLYRVYTFELIEAIKNIENDSIFQVYMPVDHDSSFNFLVGDDYFLVLARTTDIYYNEPVFYLLEEGEPKASKLDTVTYINEVLKNNTTMRDGVFNLKGRYLDTTDIQTITDGSSHILRVAFEEILYENAVMYEMLFKVIRQYKGSSDKKIIISIPKYVEIQPQASYLVCLFKDGNYTLAARHGIISTEHEDYERYMKALENSHLSLFSYEDIKPFSKATVSVLPERTFTPHPDYVPYMEINGDMVGWFKIDGTVIDYPVLQGLDNDYYLNHDINNKPHILGSIILDYRCDIKNIERNTMVYGHNTKNKTMFHMITQYKNKTFYDEHRVIEFNTLYDKMKWQVFAVHVVDGGYGYSISYPLSDDEAYALYIKDIEERNIYIPDIEVGLEDKILTLVTCSYEFDNARTIVHAKLIESIPVTEY